MKNPVHLRPTILILLLLAVVSSSFVFLSKAIAADTTPILGTAVSVNTNNYVFFTSEIYGANVVISEPDVANSNIRTVSGYAWSQDLGWIKFTQGETAGVFVDYSTGAVTGSAYIINTGHTLDFTNFGSNVVVNTTTGVLTGYVWSEDIGWIDMGDGDVYVKDSSAPSNVSVLRAYSSDAQIQDITSSSTEVYSFTTPYFEWDVPLDPTSTSGYQGSGIQGYYVYWGPSGTALPSSSGVFQEESSITTTVAENQTYYLRIQTVDNQGNVYTGPEEEYTLFQYNADVIPPTNVKYIVTPSGTFGSIDDMFFSWPSTAGVTSTDSNGILGWQYSLNGIDNWTGSETSAKFGIEYIPFEESTYTHQFNEEKDNIGVGNNIIYFRSVDNAGNFSNYVTGGIAFGGFAPQFPAESTVTVTPSTNTSNQFALNWPEALADEGRTIDSYYYMVNTQPPATYDTLSNNSTLYIPSVTSSVSANMLRGAVKGENIVYVVAVDDQEGYSQSNVITGTFTLDSSLPDPVQNLSLADTSIKEVELWRASLNWEEPTYKGNGDLTYTVQRSNTGTSWTTVGTTKGLSFTDTLPESATYYYQVGVSDSTDSSTNAPTLSPAINANIHGKYTQSAELVSDVTLSNISTRHATISWITDRNSDTKVMFGVTSENYFKEEAYTSAQATEHSISLNNLEPDTIYYFKAKWTDEDGNTGLTQEMSFKTDPTPKVISSEVERTGLNYAMITFEVQGAAKASILYGKNLSYTSLKETNTSTSRSKYTVILEDLQDGTTYNYKIRLTDTEDYIYDSIENHTFVTPPSPRLSNVRVQELKDVASPTVMFSWTSNTEVNSVVRYAQTGSSELNKVDTDYIEGLHEMEISGLKPETQYIAYVEGVDQYGNKAVSEGIYFTTQTDTRPPKIFNVKVEEDLLSRTVQTDKARSAQLVVTWETDEPATSRVEFGEGGSGVYTSSSKIDQDLRTKHLVIVSGLTPSKVYSLQLVSADDAENTSKYGPLVSITPKSNNTVLETVFGTVANIFKIF